MDKETQTFEIRKIWALIQIYTHNKYMIFDKIFKTNIINAWHMDGNKYLVVGIIIAVVSTGA
jgi:hypothetical protein